MAEKGVGIVVESSGITLKKLAYWGKGSVKDQRLDEVSRMLFQHTLQSSDVRIAVMLAARLQDYEVEEWLNGNKLKSQQMKDHVMLKKTRQGSRVPTIPDAYFILNLRKRIAHFFLELDRTTMSSKCWKTRVLGYRAYTESGKYQDRYHTTSLRILTVTTEESLADLKKTTEAAGGNQVFWFTTIE